MDFEDDVEDLWCEDCQHNHGLDCPKLGPAIRVEDRKVQTKAVATLPDNLSIRMIGGSRRVIASQPIARRTQFGPLEAKIVHEESMHVAFKYKIFGQQIVQHCLDLTNENDCNWMSLVTMSSDPKQQNMVSFQHKAQIFFLAMRDIQAGETLFAWYSPKYEAKLLQDAKKGHSSQSDTRRRNVKEAVQGNENLSPSQILSSKVNSEKSVLSSSDENLDVDIKDKSGNSPICSIDSLAAQDDLSDEGGSGQEETADVVSEDDSEDFKVRDAPVEASQSASSNQSRSHRTMKEQTVGNSDLANCEKSENRDSKILTKANMESGPPKNVSDKQERGSKKSKVANSCPFCLGRYPTTENLTNHMNVEHRNHVVNRYKCCKCAKNFKDFIRLQTHELGHESLLTSVCQVCGVRVLKTVADSHLQKKHPESTEYSCLDCQEKFVTLQKFALHVRDHMEKELVEIQQTREDFSLEKVSSQKKKNKKEKKKKGRINSKKSKEVKSVNNHKFEERCFFTDGEKTPTSSPSSMSAASSSSSCCNVSLTSRGQRVSETKKRLHEKRTKLQTERIDRRGKRNDEKTLAEERSSDSTIQMVAKVHDTRQSRKRGRLKMCSLSGTEDGDDLQPTQEGAEESGRMENHESLSDGIKGSDSPAGERMRIQSVGMDKDSECPISGQRIKRRKIKRKVEKETDRPLSFSCQLCDKVFHSSTSLTNHNVKHKQRKHRCQHCNYSCITMSTLDEHILNTHKDVTLGIPEQFKYSCETEGCDKVFLSLGRLTKHLQYHLPVGQRRRRTSLEQDRDDTLRMEMIRGQASPLKDQSQDSIHCPVCKREFDEVKVRNVHLCIHFRSIPCEGNKDVLVEVPSRGGKALTCTKCNQVYTSTNYLVQHYQKHHRIRVQLCCFCFDPMESNARLKQHMMDHISNDKTTLDPNVSGMLANFHTCGLCFAIFPNRSTLLRHTTSHVKAKDFICEICGKAFGRKDTLEDHVERHVQDKTFQCQICGKYLKTARSLVLHLATHTNERNFQCKFCLRGFKQMGNLNKHLLTCGLKESARTFQSINQL